MQTTNSVHLDHGDASFNGYVIEDLHVGCVSAEATGNRLVIFSDADRLELLGKKCIEIADELRAFTAAKDDVAA